MPELNAIIGVSFVLSLFNYLFLVFICSLFKKNLLFETSKTFLSVCLFFLFSKNAATGNPATYSKFSCVVKFSFFLFNQFFYFFIIRTLFWLMYFFFNILSFNSAFLMVFFFLHVFFFKLLIGSFSEIYGLVHVLKRCLSSHICSSKIARLKFSTSTNRTYILKGLSLISGLEQFFKYFFNKLLTTNFSTCTKCFFKSNETVI